MSGSERSALVVGMGSIGSRHARLLAEAGYAVSAVSARADLDYASHAALGTALDAGSPALVVVANPTAAHGDVLDDLAARGYDGRVLVEKPLFARARALPAHRFAYAAVGYNLRQHPVVRALRAALQGERPLAASLHAGQYLPDWRPGSDHRASYSSHRARGGGVLRDLSHELDLALWLLGGWRRVAALGGRLGDVTVDSDDCWSLLLETARCPVVSVHLSYHDRRARRVVTVTTERHSLVADLVAGTLTRDGELQRFDCGRDDTYRRQLAALDAEEDTLCTLEEGLAVVRLIEAAESAAARREWETA